MLLISFRPDSKSGDETEKNVLDCNRTVLILRRMCWIVTEQFSGVPSLPGISVADSISVSINNLLGSFIIPVCDQGCVIIEQFLIY